MARRKLRSVDYLPLPNANIEPMIREHLIENKRVKQFISTISIRNNYIPVNTYVFDIDTFNRKKKEHIYITS